MIWGIIILVAWAAMFVLMTKYKKTGNGTYAVIALVFTIVIVVMLYILLSSGQKSSVGAASVTQERKYDYYVNGQYVGSGTERETHTTPFFGKLMITVFLGALAYLISWLIAKVIVSGLFNTFLVFMLISLTLGIAMLITGIIFVTSPHPTPDYQTGGPICLIVSGVLWGLAILFGFLLFYYQKKHPESVPERFRNIKFK